MTNFFVIYWQGRGLLASHHEEGPFNCLDDAIKAASSIGQRQPRARAFLLYEDTTLRIYNKDGEKVYEPTGGEF